MDININKENKKLIAYISGRLDSSTADAFEKGVFSEINDTDEVVLNFKNVEYISSASLRVILKIKKQVNNTVVEDVNNDVFDIFTMTGFSEIIKVCKAMRELDVSNCEVIGVGAIGTVYRISPDTIVKVFKEGYSLADIERERNLAKKAFVFGVPTAIAYDIVKVGNCYGAVFELLDAKLLLKVMMNDIDNIDKYIKWSVDVMKIIHGCEANGNDFSYLKGTLYESLKTVLPQLDDEHSKKLKQLVDGLKEDHNLIHGDYHIKNVMVQNNEPFIIDMDTMGYGNIVFEFAYQYSCYIAYQEVDVHNCDKFFGINLDTCKHIFYTTIDMYFNDKDAAYKESVIKKCRVVSYIQLIERFTTDPEKQAERALFIKEISELVDELDSINI